jgi:hypothetical protein
VRERVPAHRIVSFQTITMSLKQETITNSKLLCKDHSYQPTIDSVANLLLVIEIILLVPELASRVPLELKKALEFTKRNLRGSKELTMALANNRRYLTNLSYNNKEHSITSLIESLVLLRFIEELTLMILKF